MEKVRVNISWAEVVVNGDTECGNNGKNNSVCSSPDSASESICSGATACEDAAAEQRECANFDRDAVLCQYNCFSTVDNQHVIVTFLMLSQTITI